MATSTSQVTVIPGNSAFSSFRRQNLASAIGAADVQGQYIHYVDVIGPFDPENKALLERLLTDGHHSDDSNTDAPVTTFYVLPRPGTISPWSSKATSIAHVTGFRRMVGRIERGIKITVTLQQGDSIAPSSLDSLYDRMTETISEHEPQWDQLFAHHEPGALGTYDLYADAKSPESVLQQLNLQLGLALDASEIKYLAEAYAKDGPVPRNPTDVELFMFAQVNSEHCRHKIFNATWIIDGQTKPNTLFGMIRNTHKITPAGTISAYSDNAAVLQGSKGSQWAPDDFTGVWKTTREDVQFLIKVETHNHPTAVSPFPGAATGSGGEIRDEGATGRGSRPKAGLSGFCVSDLLIPEHRQPWELDYGKPHHIASSLDIMTEAPIGSAAFNNEFGRPCLTGYFRTLSVEMTTAKDHREVRGYHKPIMIAGGVGTVRPQFALKDPDLVNDGDFLIVMGGPAMLIGLGGGAASSIASGEGSADLDFASVQRGNPEMQRRAQEVINACAALGTTNPILFIHDVGAGGLSNALPELAKDSGLGAQFELRDVDCADKSMSPLQIWCCEAQERYVLAVAQEGMNKFRSIAKRERCDISVVGRASNKQELRLTDRHNPASNQVQDPINLPMDVLFGKPPKMTRDVRSRKVDLPGFDSSLSLYVPQASTDGLLDEAISRVLQMPAVGSKSFLITIGDRTVNGLTARDQMVGPWQVPVADVAVTATSLTPGIEAGEAMAMGEKPTLALISPAASARMAVAESLLNLTAADLPDRLSQVKLSANWMSAANHPGEGAGIYEAVETLGMDLCPKLGIAIPVGKDSMSMKMRWKDGEQAKEVTAPLSVNITAFAPVLDIKKTWTPQLKRYSEVGESTIFFVDLSMAHRALGGSILAQSFQQIGDQAPDIRSVNLFKDFFDATQQLHEQNLVLAYHDRSDGGLFTTLAEMSFAGRCGIEIMINDICPTPNVPDVIECLFNEELGAVFQVRKEDENRFKACFATCGPPPGLIHKIGRVSTKSTQQNMAIYHGGRLVHRATRADLQQKWSNTSYWMQRRRDNPACADEEYANIANDQDPGISYQLTYSPKENINTYKASLLSYVSPSSRPRVAILRDQGTNGQCEMAFAFEAAGFTAVDVHMSDFLDPRVTRSNLGETHDLSGFAGLALAGGFSFGDCLGAGQGWAKSILFHGPTRTKFQNFFSRKDTFTLGVCNGCQVLSKLKELIPGAEKWPSFERNESEQYEGRVALVKISDPAPTASEGGLPQSVFFHGMHDTVLPIAVAHGEGRASFLAASSANSKAHDSDLAHDFVTMSNLAPIRYVDNKTLSPTTRYPANPNGSPEGIAGVRSTDGRVLALMPHPERTILGGVGSYIPDGKSEEWGEFGPWLRMFQSARRWVG